MRNRQLIVRWLMRNTHAVQERFRDGKTYYVVTDVRAFHDGVGRLLAEVQRIKSQGDVSAARALVENTGLSAREIVEKAMAIAADTCVYTNHNIVVDELPAA
mgnify:CR=1 FL=1